VDAEGRIRFGKFTTWGTDGKASPAGGGHPPTWKEGVDSLADLLRAEVKAPGRVEQGGTARILLVVEADDAAPWKAVQAVLGLATRSGIPSVRFEPPPGERPARPALSFETGPGGEDGARVEITVHVGAQQETLVLTEPATFVTVARGKGPLAIDHLRLPHPRALGDMLRALDPAILREAAFRLRVSHAEAVPFGYVASVLTVLRDVGVTRVAFGDEKEEVAKARSR